MHCIDIYVNVILYVNVKLAAVLSNRDIVLAIYLFHFPDIGVSRKNDQSRASW